MGNAGNGGDHHRSLELIRLAQGGDRSALNVLIERYEPRVRKMVRANLGNRLRQQLESRDIVQETFIAAVHDFDRFEVRDEGGFLRWLCRIAENRIHAAANFHGARKRDAGREVHPDADDEPVEQPADSTGPLDRAAKLEEHERVEACLADLRDEYRAVIHLRDYERASWEEIASALDCPSPDAARMRYARAIAELSGLLRRRRGP